MNTVYLRSLFFGFTLSSFFFYPLIATLNDESWLLQWNPRNAIELLVAFLLTSLFFFLIFFASARIRKTHIQTLCILGIIIIPALSFGIHITRQIGMGWFLVGTNDFIEKYNLGVGIIFIGIIIFVRYEWVLRKIIIGILFVFFPLSIFTLITITRSYFITTITSLDKLHPSQSIEQDKKTQYVFILFDELSYEYLYRDGRVREEFPNFSAFASLSTQYHNALAPGRATVQSVPQYLLGTRAQNSFFEELHPKEIFEKGAWFSLNREENIFSQARKLNMHPMAFGPYLPYCEMFLQELEQCKSYSIYNFGTVAPSFSILNPIYTTFILWPRQLPLGLVKRRWYAIWQRNGILQTLANTQQALQSKESFFVFTHFHIPHLPFVFQREGFKPANNPFLQNDENYNRQLEYVDTLVGTLIAELHKQGTFHNTTIAIFSDHNYRIMFPTEKHDHVPLLIKRPNQQTSEQVNDFVNAEEILTKLFQTQETPKI